MRPILTLAAGLLVGLSFGSTAIFTIPKMVQALGSRSHQTSSEANRVRLSQAAVVNGLNVKVVNHAQGSFKDLGNGNWGEADLQNKTRLTSKRLAVTSGLFIC